MISSLKTFCSQMKKLIKLKLLILGPVASISKLDSPMSSRGTIEHLRYCLDFLTPKQLICGVSAALWLNYLQEDLCSLL